LRPCRRVDDLLLRPLRLRSHVQVRSGKPIRQALSHRTFRDTSPAGTQAAGDSPPVSSRSRAIHTTRAPSLRLRRPQRVIRHIAPSSRGVPLPVSSLAQPGRTTQVFPSRFRRRPTALLGFFRALRRFDPAARVDSSRLLPHDARCRSNPLSLRAARRHFCRSGPTCRSCLLIRPD